MATERRTRKWNDWYAPEDTPEERKLILKLDLLIVPYAFILYWVKFMDQTNISIVTASIKSLPLLTPGRQCIRFRYEGRARLRWQRTCAVPDHICGWKRRWSLAFYLSIPSCTHAPPRAIVGSGLGYLYTATIPSPELW